MCARKSCTTSSWWTACASAGAIFVDDLEQIPDGSARQARWYVSFRRMASARRCVSGRSAKHLFVVDATCPLVTKVHLEAIRYAKDGYDIVLIGHPGHEEVEGTMGEVPHAMHLVASLERRGDLELPGVEKLVYLTQTTLQRR